LSEAIGVLQPKTLICVDCREPFEISVEEQRFYAERGYRQPIRCADCRADRRAERNGDLLKDLESSPSSLSWAETLGHYGGTPGVGRSDRTRQNKAHQSFPATCTQCGKETQVPFMPRRGRPVFCRSCFETKRHR
jgi:CxxC-x17-CxxC domain-containing protein